MKNVKKSNDPRQDAEIQNILEGVHSETSQTLLLRNAMNYWDTARNYPNRDWKGTEKFYFWLAVMSDTAALESVSREKYPSSTEDLDGRAWRILLPHKNPERKAIVVDINSIAHDGV